MQAAFTLGSIGRPEARSSHDVITGAMVSQITRLTIVYSAVYLGTDQGKHQSFASLVFVRGIHRWPVNSPHKWASNAENVSIWWRHHAYLDWVPTNMYAIQGLLIFITLRDLRAISVARRVCDICVLCVKFKQLFLCYDSRSLSILYGKHKSKQSR